MDDYKYKFCTTFEDVKELVRYCKQTGYCCNDFETNAEHCTEPTSFPTIISISFQPGSAWVVPLAHKDSPLKHIYKKVLRYIGIELIENPKIIKIAQNLKFEYNWWRKYGIIMQGRLCDTMLAKYLLNEERPHGLKEMVEMFIPEFAGYDLPGQPSKDAERDKIVNFWTNVELQTLSKYGALDADLTFRLWVFFENRIFNNNFQPLLRNLLMMATRVLADAEWVGMFTDREYLKNLCEVYKVKIDACEVKLRELPDLIQYEKKRFKRVKKALIMKHKNELSEMLENGASARVIANKEKKISDLGLGIFSNNKEREMFEPINFASPKQIIDLFFYSDEGFNWDVIAFTIDKKTKKKTNTPSVSEDVLTQLNVIHNHPVLQTLMELRGLSKLNSTYVAGMYERLHSNDRIHGSFLLHGTVTGRLCIAQDCLLYTNKGEIKIGDIVPKDEGCYINPNISTKVITHTGEYKEITHLINKGKEEMFEVELENGFKIKCTENHIFLTDKGWLKLKNITDENIIYWEST